jgi:dihydrofolate reductase
MCPDAYREALTRALSPTASPAPAPAVANDATAVNGAARPGGWGENPPFHAPVFVVTHRGGGRIEKNGGTSYTFVTGGVAAAVEQARGVAGGRDVLLAGGVSIARQALAGGLADEVVLHVVPKLVGRGVRLFDAAEVDLRCIETIQGEGAVHLRYGVQ